jgi:hypothetical protein
MTNIEPIIVGVFAGVLSSALIFILSKIWLRILLPWYQKIIYKGIDIETTWVADFGEGAKSNFELTLKQNAHDLTGHALVIKESGEKLLFKAKGSVWEGYISLSMKTVDRKRLSFANILLKVCNGGSKLEGKLTFRNMSDDAVSSSGLHLVREKAC